MLNMRGPYFKKNLYSDIYQILGYIDVIKFDGILLLIYSSC